MSGFVGKRIVITGGAGGIGVETARAFMEQGGHVLLVDVDEERLLQAQTVLGRVRLGLLQSALATPAACAAARKSLPLKFGPRSATNNSPAFNVRVSVPTPT